MALESFSGAVSLQAMTPHGEDLPCSSENSLELILPVDEVPPPPYPPLSVAEVYARNAVVMRETVYDEAYLADSLRRKVRVPFVM